MTSSRSPSLRLFRSLSRVTQPPPSDLATAIRRLPAAEKLPYSGVTWMLIGLIYCCLRQRAAKRMLIRCASDKDPYPQYLQTLGVGWLIPRAPGWEVSRRFSDGRVTIRNRKTGEKIDVNTQASNDAWTYVDLDQVFTGAWEESSIEYRAVNANPGVRSQEESAWELKWMRLLRNEDDSNVFQLADPAFYHIDGVRAFCRLWKNPKLRLWLSALIGDWITALEQAGKIDDEALKKAVAERAQEYRDYWGRELCQALESDPTDVANLEWLKSLRTDDLLEYADRAFHSESLSGETEEFLLKIDDPRWCPQLFEVFTSVCGRPATERTEGAVADGAYRLLFHGYRREDVLAALDECEENCVAIAMLYEQFAREKLVPFVRRVLRQSGSHSHRSRMLMCRCLDPDEPWEREELQHAFNEVWEQTKDPIEAIPMALALEESKDEQTSKSAMDWLDGLDFETSVRQTHYFQEMVSEVHDWFFWMRRTKGQLERLQRDPENDRPQEPGGEHETGSAALDE